MANPPFAGDIKEPRMIARYDLAKKPDGKWQSKVGRDILFIERNLDFLKPGGRMAIVLPQGRFNNSSDKNIRDFIAERCRILAVVGLHGNTFKPHTGTKTSVLFVQKWNDDPKAGALCPRKDDYNIFFATMRKSGKDNSGDKIWRKISSSAAAPPNDELSDLMPPSPVQRVVGVESDFLRDNHEHLVVDHDLYNHEGKTEDGIAEAFIEFAKKENFSFFELSPSVAPFDAVKYQQLMDGLEAVELSLKEALKENISFRVDSDFFKKQYLQEYFQRNKFENIILGDIAFITDGQHGYHEVDETSNISHITAKNTKNWFTDKIGADGLAQWVDDKNKRSSLQENDILLANRGTIGCCSIVKSDILPANIDQDIARIAIISNSPILPEYLLAYLNSNIGYDWVIRNSSGMVQQGLPLNKVRLIPIPFLNIKFQLRIKSLIDLSWETKELSKDIYQQAEDLLLSELGLQNWQSTEETIAVKSFAESFLSSERLDAEYYQPKYDQAEEAIKNCGFSSQNLGSLIEPIQNGFDYREYNEEGTPYIRVGDVKNGQINFDSAVKIPITMADVDKPVGLQIGDILFTRKGSFGNSAVVTELEVNGIISSEIMLLRLTSVSRQKVLPEYVSLFLNSKFGYLQVERRVHGVAYYSISQPDLANLLIPILPKLQQQKIVEKINSSFSLKLKSKQLLEIAKTRVEQAIETDEATATTWINQQLEALGINLTTTT
ncbi:N-6 DNA methylase [Halotia branconii]|uniref:N-6 DNA methylase n=1 Tax=Halotia branconii CENA392 TaxID=1539056 RepID=A0AAJ6NNN5_9CYAN|nr:N-6 DNA methylase [Halotia branconii]WGV23738.1 N-6 DNA methylase [Halotia branconii CENA392]